MKQIVINVVGILLILVITIWQFYNSVDYFSKNITDLIYVFATALACGIVLYIFNKFSNENQLKIRIILCGAIAMLFSGFCIWSLFMSIQIFRLKPSFAKLTDSPYIIVEALNVIIILMTAGIWWFFCQLRNKSK